MPIPDPCVGLAIRYAFLWSHEAERGQEEGSKDRPAVVVLMQERRADGANVVTVAPITHRPSETSRAVEIPHKVKKHLGLDDDASFIVLEELNRFVWPGPDLRPLTQRKPGIFSYGIIPHDIYRRVRELAAELLQARQAVVMTRSEG
jgi:hypothetical protein